MSGQDGPALESRRVLIVEDLYLVADDLRRLCRRHGGEVVGPVPDVARARELAADEQLDFAILDVDLRGEDVFGVAATLDTRGIPFIFVTGHGPTSLPARFRDVPMVAKPFSEAEVLESILRVLRAADGRERG